MDPIFPTLNHAILKQVAEIDEFKGRWNAARSFSVAALDQLRGHSLLESAGASTRLEGMPCSLDEVSGFLAESAPSERSGEGAGTAGYAAALRWICGQEGDGSLLSEEEIRGLHRILQQFSSPADPAAGEYKKFPNTVSAFNEQGRQIGILFETCRPAEVGPHMEKLLAWARQAEQDGLHPLLLTAIFVFRFLLIHPFQDGNTRLSSLLAGHLLLRFGYSYLPYASLERMIEEEQAAYYAALRKTQQSLKWSAPDWTGWLEFFLGCLVRQKRHLEQRIRMEQALPLDLSGLALDIAALLEQQARVSVSSIILATGASRNAVRAALRHLAQRSLIQIQGRGRSTHYTFQR